METIGIDFGGTSVKLGVLRADAMGVPEVVDVAPAIPTAEYDGPEPMLTRIGESVELLRDRHAGVCAIGVGVPGFVDWERGLVYGLTNVPGWRMFPLRDRLSKMTGLPVSLDNDANAMAYAEWRFGAGVGCRSMVGVTLGTGVGGGLILDGSIFRGHNSLAGEIGQMSIDFRGKDGPYGNFGALERYVGHHRVTARAQVRYAEAGRPRSQPDCTPERVAAAAAAGDPVAVKLWQDLARELATALAGIVWLLNPEKVVVGGGMSRAGEVLFDPLRRSLESQLDGPFLDGFELAAARFGSEAGVVGTALLAADAVGAGAA